jgi:hypothetical protein
MAAVKSDQQPSFVGPHEGRELDLMLVGKKHLAMFSFEIDIEREIFPEQKFDLHVAVGRFVKDIRTVEFVSGDAQIRMHNILYATANEVWRISAMRMIQDIYYSMGPGWRPDLERVIGSLLGYERNDVELFIERLASKGKISRSLPQPC